jgi:hypothetical protein
MDPQGELYRDLYKEEDLQTAEDQTHDHTQEFLKKHTPQTWTPPTIADLDGTSVSSSSSSSQFPIILQPPMKQRLPPNQAAALAQIQQNANHAFMHAHMLKNSRKNVLPDTSRAPVPNMKGNFNWSGLILPSAMFLVGVLAVYGLYTVSGNVLNSASKLISKPSTNSNLD